MFWGKIGCRRLFARTHIGHHHGPPSAYAIVGICIIRQTNAVGAVGLVCLVALHGTVEGSSG